MPARNLGLFRNISSLFQLTSFLVMVILQPIEGSPKQIPARVTCDMYLRCLVPTLDRKYLRRCLDTHNPWHRADRQGSVLPLGYNLII